MSEKRVTFLFVIRDFVFSSWFVIFRRSPMLERNFVANALKRMARTEIIKGGLNYAKMGNGDKHERTASWYA